MLFSCGGANLSEENRKENKQIKFRVTSDEFERLRQMADMNNMSVPKLAKMRAENTLIKPPAIDRQGAIEIAKAMRPVGVNINQIAKQVNESKEIDEQLANALLKELNSLFMDLVDPSLITAISRSTHF